MSFRAYVRQRNTRRGTLASCSRHAVCRACVVELVWTACVVGGRCPKEKGVSVKGVGFLLLACVAGRVHGHETCVFGVACLCLFGSGNF